MTPLAPLRHRAAALLMAAVALLLPGCWLLGGDGDEQDGAGDAADTLVVMLEAAPKTLDPVNATDAYGVRISHQLIHEPLVRLGDDLAPAPGVAASWERPGPTRLVFRLREGLTFHDGSALTAADVVCTLRSLMDPATGSPYGPGLREKLAAVTAPDARTVEVRLTQPFAGILNDLIVPVRPSDAAPEAGLVGSGPFRFVRRSPNEIVLERFEAYREPAGMARIVFKVVQDENTRLLKLRKGSVDLAINALPLDKLARFSEAPLARQYRVVEAPGLSYQYLGFNLEHPVLGEARVRRAIAHAIDVAALIRHRQEGHSTRAATLLPPGHPAAAGLQPYAHDPARARALLDAAGYPRENGPRFTITYKTSTDRSAVIQARAIQQNLKAVGIEVAVRSFEWGTFYEDIQDGNFELFSLRWVGVSDPDFYYELFHSSRMPPEGRNRVRYRNPEVDRLLERARVEQNETRRRELYRQVQRILHDELPYLSLWHNNNVAVVSRRLAGFRLHPTGGFQHLPEVRPRAGAESR